MNNIDRQYLELVNHILRFGYTKSDRTGTGTKSIFGWQIRHSMKDGFPLLTTKKMAWKTMVTELLWMLRGDANIKDLVDNDCHIWNGDAYKRYVKSFFIGELAKNYENDFDTYYFAIMENQNLLGWPQDGPISKEEFINKIKTDDEFAKIWGYLGPIYGPQWRGWVNHDLEIPNGNGLRYMEKQIIDQIANAIHLLKTDPDSRRIIVSAWNVGELDQMVLPPCHYSFQFYTMELSYDERFRIAYKDLELRKKLESESKMIHFPDGHNKVMDDAYIPKRAISIIWNQRSVDVGLGLPFNIASYALLLEIIAKEVNMVPEEVIGNLGDCHIYLNHEEGLKDQLTRIPYELPKLTINTEFWQTVTGECGVGPLNTRLKGFEVGDFIIENYQSHPAIKLPLSN